MAMKSACQVFYGTPLYCLMFSHDKIGVMGYGEKAHVGEVPLESHHIKGVQC